MQLLIYISPYHPYTRNLVSSLSSLGSHIKCTHLPAVETLVDFLSRPAAGQSICILAPSSPSELNALIDQRHLMRDLRIVLILPENDGQMSAQSHLLRPRFISKGKNSFSDVKAVVIRMMRKCEPKAFLPVHLACGS